VKLLLKVENLTISILKENKKTAIVKNVSYYLESGKTLAIVGESGSGKTIGTFAINQLLPKSAVIDNDSKILWHENDTSIDLCKLSVEEIRNYRGKKITTIFQEPMTALNPTMSCGKQVKEMYFDEAISENEKKEKVLSIFRDVQLPNVEKVYDAYPHEISGGQRQRVMIAMALATKPTLLIADEPTTALDVTVQKSILILIKQLQLKYNLSLIFISHDLGVVKNIADTILVMKQGEIVEQGICKDVIENPKNSYTQKLINSLPKNRVKQILLENDFDLEKKLLEIKNLSVFYKNKSSIFSNKVNTKPALQSVSFCLHENETLALVGESGSGKSTIGRAIMRLIESEGDIFYNGKNISFSSTNDLNEYRQNVQIIFQDPYSSLNPKLTVLETILEPLLYHKLVASKADGIEYVKYLLGKVKLDESALNKFPHEFSGGQRQRIIIARALAMKPKILICDESVSALDVSVQAAVLDLLLLLKKEYKMSYIFITHDLAVARYISNRIMVLQNGKIVEIGNTEKIFENPTETYTKNLLGAIAEV
jgi:peptide/nickel transport system ATP-binding protein